MVAADAIRCRRSAPPLVNVADRFWSLVCLLLVTLLPVIAAIAADRCLLSPVAHYYLLLLQYISLMLAVVDCGLPLAVDIAI